MNQYETELAKAKNQAMKRNLIEKQTATKCILVF